MWNSDSDGRSAAVLAKLVKESLREQTLNFELRALGLSENRSCPLETHAAHSLCARKNMSVILVGDRTECVTFVSVASRGHIFHVSYKINL